MIPIVHMILKWEKELEIQRQKHPRQDFDVKIIEPVSQPKKKKQKRFLHNLRRKESCKYS